MWEAVVAVLGNPWVVGIGGGTLSGLIVTFVSRLALSQRDKKEYAQKLLGANREVIYAIRPGISEGVIPSLLVLDAVVEATARKYSVDRNDLHGPPEIAQELVKEVMDSSFISAQTKQLYCEQLGLMMQTAASSAVTVTDSTPVSALETYRSRMITLSSVMLGLVATLMSIFIAFYPGVRARPESFSTRIPSAIEPAVMMMIATVTVALLITFVSTTSDPIRAVLRRWLAPLERRRD